MGKEPRKPISGDLVAERHLILANQAVLLEALAHMMGALVGDIERKIKLQQAVDNTTKYLSTFEY